jgi:ribonuclease HI
MIEIYTDGLAEPTNPGIGTYGYVVLKDGKRFAESQGFAGDPVSNNHAEYAGLVEALKFVKTVAEENEQVIVKSDSKLLVNQMNGDWNVSKKAMRTTGEGTYVEKYLEAKTVVSGFPRVTFVWVPREENTEADMLSRIAYQAEIRKRVRRPLHSPTRTYEAREAT